MHKHKRILAIIPARGGSKGLPQKNILDFDGVPLIAHSINEAKKSGIIDTILVSTDSLEIKEAAIAHGADVPFIRPAVLATDEASTLDVLIHAINFKRSQLEIYDIIVLLQPTSPLRTAVDIKAAIDLYCTHSSIKPCSIVSVFKEERKYNWLLGEKPDGRISFLNENALKARQALSDIYMPNGAIYISSTEEIVKGFYTDNTFPLVMNKEYSVDIDTKEDFDHALSIYLKLKNE